MKRFHALVLPFLLLGSHGCGKAENTPSQVGSGAGSGGGGDCTQLACEGDGDSGGSGEPFGTGGIMATGGGPNQVGSGGVQDGAGGGDLGGAGASDGAGGAGGTGGVDGSGGNNGTGGVGMALDGPCDIYEDGGTPCAAAYSTVRRLRKDYTGPLYQIRVGSSEFNIGGLRVTNPEIMAVGADVDSYETVAEEGTLIDIPQTEDGFADTALIEMNCPEGTVCSVSLLFDQSGHGTDLSVAKAGYRSGGFYSGLDDFETVIDERSRLTVGGHSVHSLFMEAREGYRISAEGEGMPVDEEAQGIYMLADGTRAGDGCCWDFGNVSRSTTGLSEGNTLFFGEAHWGKGAGTGPWFGADFDLGVWMGGSEPEDPGWGGLSNPSSTPNEENPSMTGVKYALGFLKTSEGPDIEYALRMADILLATDVETAYVGPFPKSNLYNDGAVVLGVGAHNENDSFGTFYEGAIVAGYPDDSTELAVMQNIQAVGYAE